MIYLKHCTQSYRCRVRWSVGCVLWRLAFGILAQYKIHYISRGCKRQTQTTRKSRENNGISFRAPSISTHTYELRATDSRCHSISFGRRFPCVRNPHRKNKQRKILSHGAWSMVLFGVLTCRVHREKYFRIDIVHCCLSCDIRRKEKYPLEAHSIDATNNQPHRCRFQMRRKFAPTLSLH